MDLNIDQKALDLELMALEDSIFQYYYESKIEAPSQDLIDGLAMESYIQETSEMFDLVAAYLDLLTTDMQFVRMMAEALASADSDAASQIKTDL